MHLNAHVMLILMSRKDTSAQRILLIFFSPIKYDGTQGIVRFFRNYLSFTMSMSLEHTLHEVIVHSRVKLDVDVVVVTN